MAAIYLITHRGREYWCGGTLIDNRHVVTAAHCLVHKSGRKYHPRSIIVRLAAHRIYNHYDRKNTVDVYVTKTIPHAKFMRHGFYNDIGIIQLASEVKYNIDISPVCLPSMKMADNNLEGYMATVLGWGVISYGGRNAETLQQVSVPIWNNVDCQKRYVQKITKGMLCAGYHEGLKDACQGDSGGPLMVPNNSRRWILVGIVSFGSKCGEKEQPGVYTRVTNYLDWIHEVTRA
ncbi:proclotting enzyme-like [Centruroides vittatus]|uniref:proclotting enzyme-like n=1 Tax=Centruroides vittatus TaxID=120091 RepID=UPI00350FA5B5